MAGVRMIHDLRKLLQHPHGVRPDLVAPQLEQQVRMELADAGPGIEFKLRILLPQLFQLAGHIVGQGIVAPVGADQHVLHPLLQLIVGGRQVVQPLVRQIEILLERGILLLELPHIPAEPVALHRHARFWAQSC